MIDRLLFFTLLLLCAPLSIAAELSSIDIEQMLELKNHHNALIVDIRTEQEWTETGTIPQSATLQFFDAKGQYDAKRWLAKLEKIRGMPDRPIVLVCRSGNRSEKLGNFLAQQIGLNNIHQLENGILPWVQAGYPISQHCPGQLACKK
jgi:Rhodanese-related sulfurtransferase